MISVKAHYNQGRIVFLDPIKADIVTAELNIVITPSEKIRPVQLGIAHLFKTLSAIRMIMQRA